MPATGTVHIVTGTPFVGVTFNTGTSTFTISGANYTGMFNTNAILTVFGTSTTNDGYYQVVSSTFSTDTVVTVSSYAVGTSYPGTVPFVASGTGTVIWFYAGVPPIPSGDGWVTGFAYNDWIGAMADNTYFLPHPGGFVVTGSNGNIVYSTTNGASWYAESPNISSNTFYSDIFDFHGDWFAVGAGGTVDYTDSNAPGSWASVTSNTSNDLYGIGGLVVGSVDHAIAVGAGGTLITTISNGSPSAFTVQTSGVAVDLHGVAYLASPNVAAAVGKAGTIILSGVGVVTSWTPQTSGTSNDLYDVEANAANTLLVAVGDTGTILTSSDGSTWTTQTSGTTNDLRRALYAPTAAIYVVVGDTGTILTSSDATTWTSQTSGTTEHLYGISVLDTGSADYYVAVGANDTIVTSSDATTWAVTSTYLFGAGALQAASGFDQVGLNWNAPGLASGTITYNVYQGTSPGGESVTPVATGITDTNYVVTGLSPSTTYYFKVIAVVNSTPTPYSNEVTATTTAAATSFTVATQANGNFPFGPAGTWESAGAGYCRPNGGDITHSSGSSGEDTINGTTMYAIGWVHLGGVETFVMTFASTPTFTSIDVTKAGGPTHTYALVDATLNPPSADPVTYTWGDGFIDFVDGVVTTCVVTI